MTYKESPVVVVPLAEGSEELEAVSIINILRRASCTVIVTSTTGTLTVKCARQTSILCDALLTDIVEKNSPVGPAQIDMVAIPGGMPGAKTLGENHTLIQLLKDRKENHAWYAAICAAPAVVLKKNDLFPQKGTCYPAKPFRDLIQGASNIDDEVVVDEHAKVVTSQGPGTAIAFSLKLVEILKGRDAANTVQNALLM